MRRKGLKHINVGESLTFQIGDWNKNSFNKIQFSGFINDNPKEFWYLPTHQALTDKLLTLPKGSLVKATRLTQGAYNKACRYDFKILRKGFPEKEQKTLDSF